MKRHILSSLLLLMPITLWAQTKTDTIPEVIVKERKPSSDITSSVPNRTLRQEDFSVLGLHDMADAVKKLTGVSVKDYGGIGGLKTVSVRNLGAQHTAVSYDGICISNTQAGQIDIGRYSLDNVEEVSLSIGQDANLMASARHAASAGVLSITTTRPQLTDKPYLLRMGIKTGSFGLLIPRLRYWQRLGSRTNLSFDGTYTRADGNYPFTLTNGRLKTEEKRYNSDIKALKGEANIYQTFRDSSKLDAKIYYYYSERGLPGVVIYYSNSANERLWDKNFFTQVSYTKHLNRKWQIQGRLKYNYSWNRYEDTNVKYSDGKLTDIAKQNECYASATLGWKPIDWLTITLAQDLAYNDLYSNIESQPNPKRYTSLTSLSAHYTSSRLQVKGNLVGTYITENTDIGKVPADRKRLSPSLSASYRLLQDESLFLRAMIKNTFRVPTFTDMYYLHIGNTNLVPEKATEYNVGLTWSSRLLHILNIQLTLDGYYNNVSDKIICFPTTYVWKMTNFGKVYIKGADATMIMQAPVAKKINAEISLSYSLQEAKDKSDPNRPSYNSQIPYTPLHSGNIAVTVKTSWVNIGYHANICGERWSNGQNLDEYRLKPYWEHNITASRKLGFKQFIMLLSLSIQNLTNKQYEIIQYYPMPKRNITVSATIEL